MRTVSYADEHFRTTDAVADAVLRYSRVLAQGSSSDVIRIPVIVDNEQTWAEIIVGPASQITTLEVPDHDDDVQLDDGDVIADLTRRAEAAEREHAPARAVAEESDVADTPPYIDYST